MTPLRIRRAIGLAAVLTLALSTTAVADTITADGDTVTPNAQTSVNLGDVVVGQTRSLDVDFVLTCKGSSHVTPGSTLAVVLNGLILPGDGTVNVSPASIDVPVGWDACATDATVTSTTPAHVEVTAPTSTGTNREFDLMFAPDPDTGAVSNFIALSIIMNVVDSAPADDTPPVLHGVPDSMTVTTTGDSAVVSWPEPTATDDTDPSPVVSCSPASGSTFVLGTTTVTCTATDASGNSASASFDVTVVDPPVTLVTLVGRWGRPLDDSTPALVGRLGRTVPLKLEITDGTVLQGPGQIDAPVLTATRLTSCTGTPFGTDEVVGTFRWTNRAWHLQLRTGGLDVGCWRLEATVDGNPVVPEAVIRLEDGPVKAGATKHADQAATKAAHAAAVAAKQASKPSAGRHQH